jgi:hypothetical protein
MMQPSPNPTAASTEERKPTMTTCTANSNPPGAPGASLYADMITIPPMRRPTSIPIRPNIHFIVINSPTDAISAILSGF